MGVLVGLGSRQTLSSPGQAWGLSQSVHRLQNPRRSGISWSDSPRIVGTRHGRCRTARSGRFGRDSPTGISVAPPAGEMVRFRHHARTSWLLCVRMGGELGPKAPGYRGPEPCSPFRAIPSDSGHLGEHPEAGFDARCPGHRPSYRTLLRIRYNHQACGFQPR